VKTNHGCHGCLTAEDVSSVVSEYPRPWKEDDVNRQANGYKGSSWLKGFISMDQVDGHRAMRWLFD
jgi:hypothetical protein